MNKRLLIVTQALDLDDPVLSAYHDWLLALAPHFKSVEIVCLKLGRHTLPANVRVYSLGKEKGNQLRALYSIRFLSLVWQLRHQYDSVFVHMNQEYVLLAGWLWRLLGKSVFMWRNHGKGSGWTRAASWFCKSVFATSSRSYTAAFRNAVLMPVGVEIDRFRTDTGVTRVPGSVLMVGRIAPPKHVREVVDALARLSLEGTSLTLTLVGDTQKRHEGYRADLMAVAGAANIGLSIRGGVPHQELPRIYREHDIVVNVSDPGMFDKTMIEALASGCLLLTRHEDLALVLDPVSRTTGDPRDIAESLKKLSALSPEERTRVVTTGLGIAQSHSQEALMEKLVKALYA